MRILNFLYRGIYDKAIKLHDYFTICHVISLDVCAQDGVKKGMWYISGVCGGPLNSTYHLWQL